MATQKTKITDRHRQALAQVVAAFGPSRFRRSDVATRVYPMTSPRSQDAAVAISDRLLREAAAAGSIRREGHLHWVRVGSGRQLLDGSMAAELRDTQKLTLDTKCPSKWLAVDLETGDVWRGTASGWKRHAGEHQIAVGQLLAANN